ncbi:hypothetical protein P9112_002323 [Eukaryota sp. TZLM1-RC]
MATLNSASIMASIEFYFLNNLHGHALYLINEALERHGSDLTLRFWRSVCTAFLGLHTESIRDLQRLKESSLTFSVHCALIHIHNLSLFTDEHVLSELVDNCEDAEGNASSQDLLTAARFFWLSNDVIRSRDIIARLFKRTSEPCFESLALRGWLEYSLSLRITEKTRKTERLKKGVKAFKASIKLDDSNPSSRIGHALCLAEAGASNPCSPLQSLINQSDLTAIQECRLLISSKLRDWSTVLSIAESLSRGGSLMGTESAILCLLGKNGEPFSIDIVSQYTSHLVNVLLEKEVGNSTLYSNFALSILVLGKSLEVSNDDVSKQIITHSNRLLYSLTKGDSAAVSSNVHVKLLLVKVKYKLLLEEFDAAKELIQLLNQKLSDQQLKNASTDDVSDDMSFELELISIDCHLSSLESMIINNEIESAASQLSLIQDLIVTIDVESFNSIPFINGYWTILLAKLGYLKVVLGHLTGSLSRSEVLSGLSESIRLCLKYLDFSDCVGISSPVVQFLTFFFDLLSAFFNVYGPVRLSPVASHLPFELPISLMNCLLNLFPTHPVLLMFQSKITCITDPTDSSVAQSIKIIDNLTQSFEDSAQVHLIKAQCLYPMFNIIDQSKLITSSAQNSTSSSRDLVALSHTLETVISFDFSVRKTQMYLFLNSLNCFLKNDFESVLTNFQSFLPGLANFLGQSSKASPDTKGSINQLSIMTRSGFFNGKFLSQSFLIDCFYFASLALYSKTSSVEISRNLLENAVILVQNDDEMVSKLHLYRSIFELSPSISSVPLATDSLAKIKSHSEAFTPGKLIQAEIYLSKDISINKYLKCFSDLLNNVKGSESDVYALQGDAFLKVSRPKAAHESFKKALDFLEKSGNSEHITKKKAFMTAKIANLHCSCHQFASAVSYYETAIDLFPEPRIILDFVHLLRQLNRDDYAKELLDKTNLTDSSNEPVKSSPDDDVMSVENNELLELAKTAEEEGDIDSAINHWKGYLTGCGEFKFEGFMKFCLLLRKKGKLSELLPVLETVKKHHNHEQSPHVNFLKGMYFRYRSSYKKALEQFTLASHDLALKESSLLQMVTIYLYVGGVFRIPEKKSIFKRKTNENSSAVDSSISNVVTDVMKKQHNVDVTAYTKQDSAKIALQTSAEELLERIPPGFFSDDRLLGIYNTYCKLISNDKPLITDACSYAFAAYSGDMDWFPGALCIAVCYIHSDQAPKARTILKRLCKTTPSVEFEEEYQLACLILAQLYIQSKKFEYAVELCDKVLAINCSSSLAWELKGDIDESDHAYRDAAQKFERAWALCAKESSVVGYKLAFNYLKAGQLLDAIDVCHAVLRNNPGYSAIVDGVLLKAKAAIKP